MDLFCIVRIQFGKFEKFYNKKLHNTAYIVFRNYELGRYINFRVIVYI